MTAAHNERSYFFDEASSKIFEQSYISLLANIQKKLVSKYLPSENMQRIRHGGGWSHPGAPQSYQSGIQQHSSAVSISFEDIVKNDLSAIDRFLLKFTEDMERQFLQTMYSTISAACEQSGNVVDAKAEASLAEAYAKMLEKVEFSADKEGNVRLPEVHMGSEQFTIFTKAIEAESPEYHQRIEEIIARKTAEALNREAGRKARFIRYGENA